jgi:hypothetical protein
VALDGAANAFHGDFHQIAPAIADGRSARRIDSSAKLSEEEGFVCLYQTISPVDLEHQDLPTSKEQATIASLMSAGSQLVGNFLNVP